MIDKNMIALAEIRNGYTLPKYGNLTLEQNLLIKYDNLCLSLIKENQELKKQYCERTDCSGRFGNSKKVDQLEKELEQLKEIEKEHQRINGELRVENKELLDYKKGYFDLQQENKQLKYNWNELKEYCKNNYYGTTTIGILDKMQELEGKNGEN